MEITMTSKILKIAFVFIFVSCTQFKSGHFVKIKEGESFKSIAKQYSVSRYDLERENDDKSFVPGEWVFVPEEKGILPHIFSKIDSGWSLLGHKAFLWPVPSSSRVSSRFGTRWGRPHEGLDIAAQRGAHILASNSGVVVYSGNELGGYGNIIVIAHKGGFFSVYAHNQDNYVTKGQVVKKGQVIGRVGNTGKSTGPHLHFEVRRQGKALNPSKFISFSN